MTIQYTTGLTFEEQIRRWETGSDEEAKLGQWLRQQLPTDDYDEGYDAGYSDARDEFEGRGDRR